MADLRRSTMTGPDPLRVPRPDPDRPATPASTCRRSLQRPTSTPITGCCVSLSGGSPPAHGRVADPRRRLLPGPALSPLDAFFGTLQMFALDAPRDLSAQSVPLGVARFTAPLALVMASVVAVTAVVGQTVRHGARLRRVKAHVVVLGLSDNSTEFAHELLEQGRPVVVVEVDGEHPGLRAIKGVGAMVVVGDASREQVTAPGSSRPQPEGRGQHRRRRPKPSSSRGGALHLPGSRESTVHVLLEDYWLHEELARTEFMSSEATGPRSTSSIGRTTRLPPSSKP